MFSPTCQTVTAKFKKALICSLLLIGGTAAAQETPQAVKDSLQAASSSDVAKPKEKVETKWYENISLRGYVQVRYNRLLETNPSLKSDHDRSIGDNGGFFI